MKSTNPPALATWLLRCLASGPRGESLAGDLIEQFRNGRPRAWYWRQVLAAILISIIRELREHPWLAIRSVILTSAVVIAWVESTLALYVWVGEKWVNAWVPSSGVFFEFWHPFGGGLCLVWCVGSAISGRVNERLSGTSRAAMVVASALAQLPLALWWSRPVWLHAGMIAEGPPRIWLPNYLWCAVVLVGVPISVLLGGLWGIFKENGNASSSCQR